MYLFSNAALSFNLKIKMGGRDVEGFVTIDLEKLAATWRIEISIGFN